jgi:RNA-directed DNA polymerase
MEDKYLNLSYGQRSHRRQQGKGNFLYVRYADDFVVLCNGTKTETQELKEELKLLLDQIGLTLSEEKTKITHITEGFDFLGYRVIRGMGRNGKMVPKVEIPTKAVKRFRNKIKEILAPNKANESFGAKIMALNQFIGGWCEYYRCASGSSRAFGRLSHETFYDMAHWLGRKYKLSIPAVMKRFLKDNTFQTSSRKLKLPSEYKAKYFVAKTWHNPYTEKEEVKQEKARIKRESLFTFDKIWTGDTYRPGWMDLREEIMAPFKTGQK